MSIENPPRKKLSHDDQQERDTSLEILSQQEADQQGAEEDRLINEAFKKVTAEQIKNDKLEYAAEKDLSLQRISAEAASIDELARQAEQAAKLNQNEEHFPALEVEPVIEDAEPIELTDQEKAILNTKVESTPRSGFMSKVKTGVMALLGLGLAGQAMGNEGGKEPSKTKEPSATEYSSARKVAKIPEGYTIVKKDNKTYGYKISSAAESTTPKPSGEKKKVFTAKRSGSSLGKKSATPATNTPKMQQDIVYIEAEQEQEVKKIDPFAKYSRDEQRLWFGNRPVADVYWPERNSQSVTEAGHKGYDDKNTVAVIFKDHLGKETGLKMIVDLTDKVEEGSDMTYQDLLGAGNTTFSSEKNVELIKKKAAEWMAANTGDTVSLDAQDLVAVQK